jgi:hypothetical protein
MGGLSTRPYIAEWEPKSIVVGSFASGRCLLFAQFRQIEASERVCRVMSGIPGNAPRHKCISFISYSCTINFVALTPALDRHLQCFINSSCFVPLTPSYPNPNYGKQYHNDYGTSSYTS